VRVAATTVSMISFPIHNAAKGIKAAPVRNAATAATQPGPDAHRRAKTGGRFFSAERRSPQLFHPVNGVFQGTLRAEFIRILKQFNGMMLCARS